MPLNPNEEQKEELRQLVDKVSDALAATLETLRANGDATLSCVSNNCLTDIIVTPTDLKSGAVINVAETSKELTSKFTAEASDFAKRPFSRAKIQSRAISVAAGKLNLIVNEEVEAEEYSNFAL